MVNNPHRSIVLKMSVVSAGSVLSSLSYSLKFLKAFYGEDSTEYIETQLLYDFVQNAVISYDGTNQIVVDVKFPRRVSYGGSLE